MSRLRVLGIESSCDETAAAVVDDGVVARSNVIASQHDLHAEYGGVVPEIASRAHVERILPVIRAALEEAGTSLGEIDAIAVSHRPGLIGSLLVGVAAAKALAWALGKPLVGVDHIHAHLYAGLLCSMEEGDNPPPPPGRGPGGGTPDAPIANAFARHARNAGMDVLGVPLPDPPPPPGGEGAGRLFPALGLVVSGGHTALYRLGSALDIERLGGTIDDAIGESYDKAAAMLGLGHPGGARVDALAQRGDERVFDFPISRLSRESLDLSFSGLKTAVLYAVRGVPGQGVAAPVMTDGRRADLAAGFQRAAVGAVMLKLGRALEHLHARGDAVRGLLVGGGVSANSRLRAELGLFAAREGLDLRLPAMGFCLDNAAMIAGLGAVRLRAGLVDGPALQAHPTGSWAGGRS
ncbi:MAG TPA: tRNA (adenosine(37)-N6)-threonylcarbamoyltransferase complex transferase subunit TsaD [Phycisphaerales bacterium]|nr:tRNA (adenosine(37)-N6)-threonylcarbamoyltransferase complex transferase subunit TsaD [Phycisphaerales bacterium]